MFWLSFALFEFPKKLREGRPDGFLFTADVKVCQKTDKVSGNPVGPIYIRADPKTISNG